MNNNKTAKLVNKSLSGEPEHIVLQCLETNTMYEFSQILGESISNNDITHPTIQKILNNSHLVEFFENENNQIILQF